MTAHLPRYYTPIGVAAPAHNPHPGGSRLFDGVGPDVDHEPTKKRKKRGGGIVYGGAYTPGEPGWVEAPAGWWMNLDGCLPHHTTRLDTSPRITRWAQVQGARPDHYWRVPVLLQPDGKGEGRSIFVSALDRVWKGGDTYADPADLAALQRRVLEVCYGVAKDGDHKRHRTSLGVLVADILAVGHHVSPFEIIAGEWLSEVVELRVLLAAADMTHESDGAA
ncbi:MAG TPA: hypothetical protein VD838_16020 [Anaeromyxobacteraceae bacterium]|nr:hypothetical protein [Anaeromyxobacteraceae bacterium]